MGLAERRALKDFQDNRLPSLQQQINTAAKFDVPLTVKWDTMTGDEYGTDYGEYWPQIYFEPMIEAFKDITRDEMGAEALKESLKGVVIQNVSGAYYGDRWASFQDGTLTLDHHPTTNAHATQERTKGLIAVLEKAL